ncbi:MAG TPA: type IV pili twitching motility protein PilT, partial [Myxococcota bacterium]|nr:type IV pili twitching motility protein PilT [Myxococcota bacterium]
EIMRTTRSIREAIRDPDRQVEITDLIAKGRADMQMQTFDQHLLDLYQANKIRLETASDAASNPRDFATKLALEGEGEASFSRSADSVAHGGDERF